MVDLNNDTFPEIIFGNAKGFSNTILWNRGDNTFGEMPMPTTTDYATDLLLSENYNTPSILAVVDLLELSFDTPYENRIYFRNYDQVSIWYKGKPFSMIWGEMTSLRLRCYD